MASARFQDLDCRPYYGRQSALPSDATILDYAAQASDAAGRYQRAMDARADYPTCIRLASSLARATQALATAIADAVACGNNTLS